MEKKAIIGEDGAPGMLWTEYSEDGTKTVTEYNRILTGLVDRDQHIVQAAIRMPVEHKQ